MVIDCCKHTKRNKKCIRSKDKKIFDLPRRFTKKRCMTKPIHGFSMRSSCAPYKFCISSIKNKTLKGGKRHHKRKNKMNTRKTKPKNDLYTDANPKDTISIRFASVQDVKNTIQKLKRCLRNGKYNKIRVKQVALVMMGRLKSLRKKKPQQYKLAYTFWKSL